VGFRSHTQSARARQDLFEPHGLKSVLLAADNGYPSIRHL